MDVEFVNSSYQYSENHGEVSDIQVQLSVPVAKSLEVFYSGGEIRLKAIWRTIAHYHSLIYVRSGP